MKQTDRKTPFYLSVDRIEAGCAACLDDKQRQTNLPAGQLPPGAKEGDLLLVAADGTMAIDHAKTKSVKAENAERLRRLAKKAPCSPQHEALRQKEVKAMQGYNIIMLYSADRSRLLMCKRKKDPYKGMSNLVGGKIEPGENGLDAAYRELWEETGVSRGDTRLTHVMDFKYYLQNCWVEVYAGRLNRDIAVGGDENELFWSSLDHDFFDLELFAGEGNIGHMLEQVKMYSERIFEE